MVRYFSILILIASLAVVVPSGSALAQPSTGQNSARPFGPRKQVAVIIFSGLAGAILGLSTLSFYGRPQDKLANIPVGAAVGIIVGTTYSTYKAATEGRSFYENPPPDTRTRDMGPEVWRMADAARATNRPIGPVLGTGWQWSF